MKIQYSILVSVNSLPPYYLFIPLLNKLFEGFCQNVLSYHHHNIITIFKVKKHITNYLIHKYITNGTYIQI